MVSSLHLCNLCNNHGYNIHLNLEKQMIEQVTYFYIYDKYIGIFWIAIITFYSNELYILDGKPINSNGHLSRVLISTKVSYRKRVCTWNSYKHPTNLCYIIVDLKYSNRTIIVMHSSHTSHDPCSHKWIKSHPMSIKTKRGGRCKAILYDPRGKK